MSGATRTPKDEAERAAVVALVEWALRIGGAHGLDTLAWSTAEAERMVAHPPTTARVVPRVHIVNNWHIHYAAANTAYPWCARYDGDEKREHRATSVAGISICCGWPFDDLVTVALLDLKANPTETIQEPVREAPPRVVGHVVIYPNGETAAFTWDGPHRSLAHALEHAHVRGGKAHALVVGPEVAPPTPPVAGGRGA